MLRHELFDRRRRPHEPLAIAGLFFGLGAAMQVDMHIRGRRPRGDTIYLAGPEIREYRRFKNAPGKAERRRVQGFWRNTLMTLLWCCVFYIAVPVVIYLLSYIPYVLCENHYGLSGIWDFQKFMFNFHSGLTATHPYESPWWQWPLDLRPVWYYISYRVPEGMTSTISAFGNPAVWWVCSACTGILCARLIAGRSKPDQGHICAADRFGGELPALGAGNSLHLRLSLFCQRSVYRIHNRMADT